MSGVIVIQISLGQYYIEVRSTRVVQIVQGQYIQKAKVLVVQIVQGQ